MIWRPFLWPTLIQEVARGLKDLLAYEGNVEEDLCLNFHVSIEEFGKVITVNLRENGEHVAVTNDNRDEYVRLYLDWILNTAIYEQVRAFYLGFHTLGASNALLVSPRQRPPAHTGRQPNGYLESADIRVVAEIGGRNV